MKVRRQKPQAITSSTYKSPEGDVLSLNLTPHNSRQRDWPWSPAGSLWESLVSTVEKVYEFGRLVQVYVGF